MRNLSVLQISLMLSVTKRTVQRRAIRENWPYRLHKGLGGEKKTFEFASLPVDVRLKASAFIIGKHEQIGRDYEHADHSQQTRVLRIQENPFIVLDKTKSSDWVSHHCFAHELDRAQLDKDYFKVGLVVLAYLYLVSFSLTKMNGFDEFCELFNQRKLPLNAVVYSFVATVSRISLIRWEKQHQIDKPTSNIFIVADEVYLPSDLQEMAEEIVMITPQISALKIRNHFSTIFSERRIPSVRIISRWLQQLNKHHNQTVHKQENES